MRSEAGLLNAACVSGARRLTCVSKASARFASSNSSISARIALVASSHSACRRARSARSDSLKRWISSSFETLVKNACKR